MPYRIDHTNTSNNHQRNNRHLWHRRNNRRLSAAGSSESIVAYDTSETNVTYQQQSAGHNLLSFFSYLQQLSIIWKQTILHQPYFYLS